MVLLVDGVGNCQTHCRVIEAGGLRSVRAGIDDQLFQLEVVADGDFDILCLLHRLHAGRGCDDDQVDVAAEQRLHQRVFGGVFLIDDFVGYGLPAQ